MLRGVGILRDLYPPDRVSYPRGTGLLFLKNIPARDFGARKSQTVLPRSWDFPNGRFMTNILK
jgi:hypothetical protein